MTTSMLTLWKSLERTGRAYIQKQQTTTSRSKTANALRNLWKVEALLRRLYRQPAFTNTPTTKQISTRMPNASSVASESSADDDSSGWSAALIATARELQ